MNDCTNRGQKTAQDNSAAVNPEIGRRQFIKGGVALGAVAAIGSGLLGFVLSGKHKPALAESEQCATISVTADSMKPGEQASLRVNVAANKDISNVVASIVNLPAQLVLIQTSAQIDSIQSGEVRVLAIPIGSSQQTPAGSYKVSYKVTFSCSGQSYTNSGDVFVKVGSYQDGQGGSSGSSGSSDCFIATAVYGTEHAGQINILREFRDMVLLSSQLGTGIVEFYYRNSPPIAEYISRHGNVRTFVRCAFIEPIVWIFRKTAAFWRK